MFDLRSTQASITLDAMRAGAAQAVCIGHTIGLFGTVTLAQPPYVPYMQNIAVLVFFLLSGFLIAYTITTRAADPNYGFGHYFVDRFARIYSALIPAIIAIAIIDIIWTRWTGETRSTLTTRAFFGNLFMLQNVAGPLSRFEIPSFGTAGQLWTLAIEWHIYMLAGALFFIRRSPWLLIVAAMICTVPFAYLGNVRTQDFGHGVTALWIAGFASFFAMPYLSKLPRGLLIGISITASALYVSLVPPESEFDLGTYPLLALAVVAVISLAAKIQAKPEGVASRVIRFAAAYSFTLYLVHNSVAKGLWKLVSWDPYVMTITALIVSNLFAIAIAIQTEMRHRQFAKFLERFLLVRVQFLRLQRKPIVEMR